MRIIGNLYHSGFVYEMYGNLEKNLQKKYEILKKGLVSPIENIDKIKEMLF